jgi:gliding motility-associated-like protein
MKTKSLVFNFMLVFVLSNLHSQNLVPNPDFSQYYFFGHPPPEVCDSGFRATHWYNPADLDIRHYLTVKHNDCVSQTTGEIVAGVPVNFLGYQYPISGNAYYTICGSDNGSNKRHACLQVELSETLIIGNTYCTSLWVSLPEYSYSEKANWCKNIGVLFSTYKKLFTGPLSDNLPDYALYPQIENKKENWLDTINWYLVSGSFVADSNYKQLSICVFKPDSLLDIVLNPNATHIGYCFYIDMVSVYDCTGHNYQCNAGEDMRICNGQVVQLGTDDPPAADKRQYRWMPALGLSDSTAAKPLASPTETTTYYLYVIDEFLQESYDTVTVEVIYCDIFIPNIFSPNGDGQNDVLYVRGQGIEQLSFVVYNRWGQKVFETKDPNHGWDGTINGKPAETGVYVYHVNAVLHDGLVVSRHGDVTLVR